MAVSRYWNKQFAKFDANKGNYKPTWSWLALVFSAFWYAWKGMWPKAFLILGVVSLLSALPEDKRLPAVMVWLLYPALFGKWDYYLLKKRGTYFW